MTEVTPPNNLQALGPWITAVALGEIDSDVIVDKIVQELVRLSNDVFEFDYLFKVGPNGPELTVKADDCWLSVKCLPPAEGGIVVEYKRTGRG